MAHSSLLPLNLMSKGVLCTSDGVKWFLTADRIAAGVLSREPARRQPIFILPRIAMVQRGTLPQMALMSS